jgi:hypothetical protein
MRLAVVFRGKWCLSLFFYNPSKTEIESLVRSGEVKKAIPEGAVYIDSGFLLLKCKLVFGCICKWLWKEQVLSNTC